MHMRRVFMRGKVSHWRRFIWLLGHSCLLIEAQTRYFIVLLDAAKENVVVQECSFGWVRSRSFGAGPRMHNIVAFSVGGVCMRLPIVIGVAKLGQIEDTL